MLLLAPTLFICCLSHNGTQHVRDANHMSLCQGRSRTPWSPLRRRSVGRAPLVVAHTQPVSAPLLSTSGLEGVERAGWRAAAMRSRFSVAADWLSWSGHGLFRRSSLCSLSRSLVRGSVEHPPYPLGGLNGAIWSLGEPGHRT